MTFTEKLRRLLVNMNRSKVARAAGVHPNNIYSYLHGSKPSAEAAAKLAKALAVDAGWLIDNSRGWPPVRTERALEAAKR